MNREEQIKKEIQNRLCLFGRELAGYRVLLFGSRVRGTAKKTSDFDVGVLGKQKLPLKTFYKIQDSLDSIETLYSIDWVDLNDTTDDFRREALRYSEVIL